MMPFSGRRLEYFGIRLYEKTFHLFSIFRVLRPFIETPFLILIRNWNYSAV